MRQRHCSSAVASSFCHRACFCSTVRTTWSRRDASNSRLEARVASSLLRWDELENTNSSSAAGDSGTEPQVDCPEGDEASCPSPHSTCAAWKPFASTDAEWGYCMTAARRVRGDKLTADRKCLQVHTMYF